MKNYIFGFISALIISLAFFFVFNGMIAKNISQTGIHTSSFRLTDKTIMLFVRDYSHDSQNRMSPFLIIVDDDFTIYKKQIPEQIINSNRFTLALSNLKNKVWLFSDDFNAWYEWDMTSRQFNTYDDINHPVETEIIVLIKSKSNLKD